MQVAVIDIGTNTFKIVIVQLLSQTEYQIVMELKIPVVLAFNNGSKLMISDSAYIRARNAMKVFKENVIDVYKPEKVYAYATSAFRTAKNAKEIIEKIHQKTGLHIEIISGKREAELVYLGIRQAYKLNRQPVLMLDIGGGSCEFLVANHHKIFLRQSYKIGAARLNEKFRPEDPVSQDTIMKIENHLKKTLAPLFEKILSGKLGKITTMIGSSGSFDSLYRIVSNSAVVSEECIKNKLSNEISINNYFDVHKMLIESTLSERKRMKGLILMRAELIVLASIIVNVVIRNLFLEKLVQSSYSMKEGMIWEVAQKDAIRMQL